MVCQTCKRREPYEPSPWFQHIWFLYQLQEAGYPFEKDDLTIEEWLSLGMLRKELELYIIKAQNAK